MITEQGHQKQYNQTHFASGLEQVMRLSAEGVFVEVYSGGSDEFAFDAGNLVGKELDQAFPSDVAEKYWSHLEICLKSGLTQTFEYKLRVNTSSRHWLVRLVKVGNFEALAIARDMTVDESVVVTYETVLNAEREQRLIAETLAEVTLALTSHTSLKDVLDEVLRQTQRLVPFRTAHIMLLKDDNLHIAGWQGYQELGSEELVSNLVQPLAEFPLDAEVIRSRKPLVISDTHQEPRWVVQQQTAWVRSHVVVPIVLGERVLGILRLDANSVNAFSEKDVVRLRPLTNAAAIAMENARLYDQAQQEIAERRQAEQETQRRNRELALLNKIIAASVVAVETEDILQTTCQELAVAFGLPRVTATLLNDDGIEATVVAEYIASGVLSNLNQRNEVNNDPALQYLREFKTSLVSTELPEEPKFFSYKQKIQAQGINAFVILPLMVENKVLGSLSLQSNEPREFLQQEVNLAWRVADQVAGVLVRTQLNEKHRRLSEAIEQSAESVIITDTKGHILYVNPSFERITGYCRAEVMGKKFSMLKSGEHTEAFYKEIWETISRGQVWHGRFKNKRKDGTFYTDEATISPVRNESGSIVSYVGVQRDVTREIELEEQYHQAQKMEAVGLLAGGIAHDFNNLLTVINGFAEMIQFELPPDALHLQKLASRVRYSGTQAAALVRQLLAFSRREFIEPKVLNLNKIVADITKMLERLIEENIVLETNFAFDLWPVKVDAHQIEQIIVNLTVNARDAMPEGGLLRIETQNQMVDDAYAGHHVGLTPGNYVLVTVSDTGVGISNEVKERIFEPFFTTKERGKGTGLGLATVFGIVQQYGGHIFVQSEPGKGATFKIFIPAVEETETKVTGVNDNNNIPRGSEVVLVVEDELPVRDLAAYMLRRQGYTVLEAGNGEEALRLAQGHVKKIDLLLTDTVMPNMSGKVLAERFRAEFPNTKILFTSGYTDRYFTQSDSSVSHIHFIPKPFSAAELARKVRSVLDS